MRIGKDLDLRRYLGQLSVRGGKCTAQGNVFIYTGELRVYLQIHKIIHASRMLANYHHLFIQAGGTT